MKTTLNWGYRAAQVWLDELPTWDYQVSEVITRNCDFSGIKHRSHQKCAIELFIPMGGKADYGVLGATFTPQDTTQFVVQVPVSQNEGPLLDTSLARKTDEVHIGLPKEYVKGILDGFLSTDAVQTLGAGTLRICCGANGKIGSSISLFRTLSHIITHLLALEGQTASNEQLLGLIRCELSQKSDNSRESKCAKETQIGGANGHQRPHLPNIAV